MLSSLIERCDEAVTGWCLSRSHNIDDLRRYARLRIPRPMWGYLDGGADDEVTLARNNQDFARYDLLPRCLVDVSNVDPSTTVMGAPVSMPVILAPTGMSRLFNNAGELAVATAAAEAGTVYSLSTVGTHSIEQVAEVCPGTKWFQIYVFRDRGLVSEFIERCRAAQYQALCLTVDLAVAGNRERDLRTGMVFPPKFSLATWLDFALHPLWSLKYLGSEPFQFANVAHKVASGTDPMTSMVGYLAQQFDPSVDWDAAAWMIEQWQGPFAIKGICCVEDAVRAADIGATAVILSNHGGRQLDYAASPISLVAEVKAAVGDRVEVIVDGGIRRGTDVIKALALGARACMVGRPYLFGLGAGGRAGVARALDLLKREIERDMALLGVTRVDQLNAEYVRERR
ncbi:MAG: alpha-hydroxy acid oxidase [Gammaproteobacteria bacterium]